MTVLLRQESLDVCHGALQLSLPFRQRRRPVTRGPCLLDDLRAPALRDQVHRHMARHGTAGRGAIERAEHLERAQEGVIRALSMEGQYLQEGRRKLPDGTVPRAKEINRAIMARANQARGVFHGRPHNSFEDSRKTHRSDGRVVDGGVGQHLSQCTKDAEFLVGRAGDRLAQLLEFLLSSTVVFPEALIIEFDRHIGVVDEGLLEKRDQDRIPPPRVHALELGRWGLPAQLGQPFHPVEVERGQLPGVNPGGVQELDLRERVDELGSGGRCGFSPKPIQHGPASVRVGHQQAVQHSQLRLREEWGEAMKRLQVGLLPRRRNEALQTGEARAHNAVTAQLVTGQLEQ
jgi:hypothetical protein